MPAVCRRFLCERGPSTRARLCFPVLLGVLVLLSGCGRSSFIGRQYDDFTAYYNKFHNAEAAFEKGVESIRETDRSIDRTRYLPLFLEPTGTSDDAFEPVIQKSADVLREHPNSKWVDDALLMIGRSYYYQENYAGAVQKFREIIDLSGEREPEARFWLARALIANEQYDAADEALASGLGNEDSDSWTARMQMARGELLARQEQWVAAEQALSQGLAGDLPDRLAARGAFLLGQVRQTLGDAEGARQAYQTVLDHDPRYSLAFAARLSDVELQGRHGDPETALDRLGDLEQDDKNYEMRGQMALVRARILRDNGRPDAARRVLRTSMYGEEAPSGPSQGRLQYELATLYRDAYEDFSAAAAHFDSAQAQVGSVEERRRLPTAPSDVEAQAAQFRDLAEQAQEVARLDSLLRLGRMSQEELQAFVADLREQRQRQLENQRAARADPQRAGASRQFGQGGVRQVARRQEAAPATQTRESDAGFLFHNDPARVQQGRRQFRQTWGDRPRVDNWRRRVAIRQTRTAEANEGEQAEGPPTENPASGRGVAQRVQIDLSAVPRDSARQAQMEDERAVARYELGNALFLTAQRPDSAATWYKRIIEEDSDHPIADRARYALAEVRRAQEDTAAARRAYRRVIQAAPNSSLAARARERLGQSVEADGGVRPRADTAYAQAYRTWQDGRPDSALVRMLDLAHRYPETPAAPRALLASSVIYWRQIQDGASVPARDHLAKHFPALDSVGSDAGTPDSRAATARQPAQPRSTAADSLTKTARPDTTGGRTAPPDSAAGPSSRPGRGDVLTSDDVPTDATAEGSQTRASTADTTRQQEMDSIRPPSPSWTVVVDLMERGAVVDDTIRQHRRRWTRTGASVRLCRAGDRVLIGVGSFETEVAAETARERWADQLPDESRVNQCEQPTTPQRADASSPRDSTTAPVSPHRGGDQYAPLEAILTYLIQQYPEAPQAARAESIVGLVQDRRRAADSLVDARSGDVAARGRAQLDSTRVTPGPQRSAPAAPRPASNRSTAAESDSTTLPRRAPDTTSTDSSRVVPLPQSTGAGAEEDPERRD